MKRSLLETCVKRWKTQYHDSDAKQKQGKLDNIQQAKVRKRKRTLDANKRNRKALKAEVVKAQGLGNYYMVSGLFEHNY